MCTDISRVCLWKLLSCVSRKKKKKREGENNEKYNYIEI